MDQIDIFGVSFASSSAQHADTVDYSHRRRVAAPGNRRREYVAKLLAVEQRVLLSWLWKFTHDSRALDDLLQEVYERLLRVDETRAASIESVPKYVFGVCRHVALDWQHRRRSLRIEYVGNPELLTTADPQRDVERIVSGEQEMALLMKEIRRLPARCQRILLMVKVCGYSAKEVASDMGIAETTVKKQLQIAAARCTQALEGKQSRPGLQLLCKLVGRRGAGA
jgi:RNA polymerase sigma-70 factor (ECF subfamily)